MHREDVDPTFKFAAQFLAEARFENNHSITVKDMAVMMMLVGTGVAACEREKVLRPVRIGMDMTQFLGRTGIQSRAIAQASWDRIGMMVLGEKPLFDIEPHAAKDGSFVCEVSKVMIEAASSEWSKHVEPVDVPIQALMKMRCAQSIPVAMRALAWMRSAAYARRINQNVSNGLRLEIPVEKLKRALGFTFGHDVPGRMTRLFEPMRDDLSLLSIDARFEWRFKGREAVALRVDLANYGDAPQRIKRQTYAVDLTPLPEDVPSPAKTPEPAASPPIPAPAPAPVVQPAPTLGLYHEVNTEFRHLIKNVEVTDEMWDTVDHSRALVRFDRWSLKAIYSDGPMRERNERDVPRLHWHTDAMWAQVDHDRILTQFSSHGTPCYDDEPTVSEDEIERMESALDGDFDDLVID